MIPNRTLLASTLAAVLVSAATMAAFLLQPPTFWNSWRPASCLETRCFCEALSLASPIRQPAATWSSLAYVFPGALIIGLARTRILGGSRFTAAHAILLGSAAVIVGVGSAFQHASATFAGQFLDILGMYLVSTFMLLYAAERWIGMRVRGMLAGYLALNAGLAAIQAGLPEARRYLFAAIVLIAVGLEIAYNLGRHPGQDRRWLWRGLATFGLAYVIWILDNTGVLCIPTSLLQGHAAWHLLGALAIWFLFRHYLDERRPDPGM